MTRVRLTLTAILMIAYFGFLLLGAFAQPLLAIPIYGPTPLGFLLGLVLILGSIAITGVYAIFANRAEAA